MWSELHLSKYTVQAEQNCIPGSQTCLPGYVLFLNSRRLYSLQSILWPLHMACFPAERKCEKCFWDEQSILPGWQGSSLRAGRGEFLHGEAMCCLAGHPVTPRQTRLELISTYTLVGSLPGSHPFLFCTTESTWCMGWTIWFRLWTLGMLSSVWHLIGTERWWEGVNDNAFNSLLHFAFGWLYC